MVVGPAMGAPTAASSAVNGTASSVDCTFPVTATDATGTEVTVSSEPQRVVVLAPSAAQTMWELDASEKVVGMPREYHTGYLEGTDGTQDVVNDDGTPIIEAVVATSPDLVLAPNIIGNETVQTLRDAGLTVYRYEQADSLADVTAKTRLTGRLVGEYETARTVSARTEATARAIRQATADESKPTVYYAMGGGWTAGPETFVGDLIARAGGDNVATAANISQYATISDEVLATEDPDWIVAPTGRPLPSGPAIDNSTAMRTDQILRVDRDYVSQPGPRVTIPLRKMARTIHPEAAGSITVDATSVDVPACALTMEGATESAATEVGTTTRTEQTTTTATTTTSASGPGLSVASALVALLAVVVAMRPRER
jgi:iron complex transport system substrate-binding protein